MQRLSLCFDSTLYSSGPHTVLRSTSATSELCEAGSEFPAIRISAVTHAVPSEQWQWAQTRSHSHEEQSSDTISTSELAETALYIDARVISNILTD